MKQYECLLISCKHSFEKPRWEDAYPYTKMIMFHCAVITGFVYNSQFQIPFVRSAIIFEKTPEHRKGFGTCSVELNLMIYNDFDASFSILVVHLRSYFGFDLLSRVYSCWFKKKTFARIFQIVAGKLQIMYVLCKSLWHAVLKPILYTFYFGSSNIYECAVVFYGVYYKMILL